MIDEDNFKRITQRIDSYREAMIELQIALSAHPAVGPENGGDGELLKARFLKDRLVQLGFKNFRHFDAQDKRVSSGIRPNLVTTIEGQNKNRFIWIITHLDIVPPGERRLWSQDPYQAYVKDGHVFGRGVEDNQQDMVASIFAAKAMMDEGFIPDHSINLAFVADEETSSNMGLYYMIDSTDNLFNHDDLIIVPDSGNPQGSLIEVAEKSILWLCFKTKGKQCHGSNPQLGKNAFVAASHLVTKLVKLKKLFPKTDPLFDPPQSTFEPTKKEANVGNINTIPGEDIFCMDCRVLPNYDLRDVLAAIQKMVQDIEKKFKVQIEISTAQYVQSAKPTHPDAPVVKALTEAIQTVYHIKAFAGGVGAGTVASYIRKKDYPVAVWSKTGQTAHQPDENCPIDNMLGNAKVFAHLFLQK
ncbi:MAG: diaminopimelate aminotransferase [Deltaproteobacteria bacterium HGW-Deltaproteobacteria-7]|jgi:succinyl-diaminopimelate desuccinylase|nr:MAG: diaminopimelate aminotransferase [Deltaproteobacteria bacterium HGW-Deltaproteobacteria-7]PKN52224.1 MAG: diaminopimelate aminotransferase [Deltaproteobacteria bacterium HGW-Deltaproteobacteria-13]